MTPFDKLRVSGEKYVAEFIPRSTETGIVGAKSSGAGYSAAS
jgi:hypothetical protein